MLRNFLLVLILVPVVVFAYQGQLKNGTYISINNAFKVAAPEEYTIQDAVIAGGHEIVVNFVNNYSEVGIYSVEWTPYLYRAAKINQNFDKTMQKYIPHYVANNLTNAHGTMQLISNKKIQINGKEAYQIIATGVIDNKPAVWVTTMINFRSAFPMV